MRRGSRRDCSPSESAFEVGDRVARNDGPARQFRVIHIEKGAGGATLRRQDRHRKHQPATPSSFSPSATILSASSRRGRCNVRASIASASSQWSTSSGVVRIAGIALGWIGATTALASVVKKPNSWCSPSTVALLGPLTPRQRVHKPAKANSGRSSLSANQIGVLRGVVSASSQNEVAGTSQRFRRQAIRASAGSTRCGCLVTGCPPYWRGPGMPRRATTSSRSPSAPDRSHLVRENTGQDRQVARAVMSRAKPVRGSPLRPLVNE